MSDEQDKPVDEQPEAEPQGPRGGERLAEARRKLQISVLEVAKELHLDEPKVRALERNDFDMLGAPVFAKGHLRKYAQLVGVDEADVFADYYQMTRSESIPPVVAATRTRAGQELSPGPWIAAIIVILAAAVTYWWFAVGSQTAIGPETVPATAPETVPETAPETAPETVPETAPATAPETVPETAPEQSEALQPSEETVVVAAPAARDQPIRDEPAPVASQSASEPADTLADGEILLSLNFSGDCWTEISDATGRRLFFDMGRNGRSVELTARAPIAALFGNVDNVDVRVNGNEFPITTTNPGGRTARLTIMSP
jgi:cytoskeleton protein RodZ